jgi:hypothetical protein
VREKGNAMSKESSSSGGISFVGLLTIVFITLKLIGKIDWSWWWVLSPLLAIVAIILFLVLLWLIAVIMEKS